MVILYKHISIFTIRIHGSSKNRGGGGSILHTSKNKGVCQCSINKFSKSKVRDPLTTQSSTNRNMSSRKAKSRFIIA